MNRNIITFASALTLLMATGTAKANQSIADAIRAGKVYGNFNLRSELADQDNPVNDASALTLRSRLGFKTGQFHGFSALIELEDSRIVAGQNEFTVGPTGFNPGMYSVVADPETTELDQAFVQYNTGPVMAKLGRQVIAHDGHRFVGHVGWRQDRQTFDGMTLGYSGVNKLKASYSYVTQRNRIFAESADLDSKDHLLNASYPTSIGKWVGYAYLLEVDNGTSNSLDTFGASLTGSQDLGGSKLLYALELATQDAESGGGAFDANYVLAEVGVGFKPVTAKLGYELLGSDDGNFGFATPLATLHKFNGWSDQFLNTPAEGLADRYLSLSGPVAGGKWIFVYHDFAADESSPGVDDLGTEFNVQFTRTFAEIYNIGLKFASYDAGDPGAGKVDTNRFWAWFSTGF